MDNQFYKSAVNSLRNEIKSYVSQITAKLHFDITKSAVILSQSGNGYTILLDGNTYNNIPTDIKGAVFPINSVARIMIPQANYNNMFIMGLGEYTPNPTEGDILMEQEAVATNTNYPVLLSPQTTNGARIGYFGTGVTVNPSTNTITANLNGTANKATNDINGNPIVTTYAKTTDIPTKVSQLTNDSGYITVSQAPVQSVNGKTGTVSLVTDDVPATATNRYVPAQPTTNSSNSFLNGDGNFVQIAVGGGSSSVANLFFSNTASAVGGYKILNYVADATATQASITCTSSADVLGYTYLYNDGIGTTTIDAGIWKSTFYGYVSNTQGETRLKIICFVYHTDGTTKDLFTKYTNDFDSTTAMSFYTETNRSQFSVLATDRLGFRVYGTTTRTSTTTIYFVMGGLNAAYINTPLALRHTQLRDLNGDSSYQHISTALVSQISTNEQNIALLDTDITDLQTSLATETTNRQNADTSLQNQINTKLETTGDGSNVTSTFTTTETFTNITSGSKLSLLFGKIYTAISNLISHIANTSNPHAVTKTQVGLGNVANVLQYSADNPQVNITGNAATATSLQTARKIGANTAVSATPTNFDGTANITIPINSVYASYTAWGGRNLSGEVSPVDLAINNEFSANRLSFMTPSDILIEYSNDGGSTWSTYSTTDSDKQSLVTLSHSYYIGAHSSSITLNDKLRVTLTAAKGVLCTSVRQIQLQTSSNGSDGGNVTLEAKTIANYDTSTDTWSTLISNQSISGWSGWNVLNINNVFTFGGRTTQTSQYRQIRFTFGITSLRGTFSNALQLLAIRLYGENLWESTNNYQRTGNIYSFDVSQNATFPAQVTSTQFNGTLNGNAATSTQFASVKSVALTGDITGSDSSQAGWSVATTLANSGVTAGSYGLSATATPAFGGSLSIPYITFDAKGRATSATNHTLTIPSTLASTTVNGLMSSSDKTKLNGIESGAQVNTVTSVNSKTGTVVLSASDIGALPSTTTYVSSVNGNSGAVTLNDVKFISQTLTSSQQSQARTNIGAGTSSFSGSYTDLTNQPTIGNGTLTIQKNSSSIGTFTANATGNTTINVVVPTSTSDLTNNSGFLPTTITSPANGQIIAYDGTKWINQAPQSFSQQQSNWGETNTASVQYIQNKPNLSYTEITNSIIFNKTIISAHIWYNSSARYVFGMIETADTIENGDLICTFSSPILSSSFSGICGTGVSMSGIVDIPNFTNGKIISMQKLLYPQDKLYPTSGITPIGIDSSFGSTYHISFIY